MVLTYKNISWININKHFNKLKMERQPSPYKANCVSSWKSTNLTELVDDPEESVTPNGKPKKNAIKYNLAVRFNIIILMCFL